MIRHPNMKVRSSLVVAGLLSLAAFSDSFAQAIHALSDVQPFTVEHLRAREAGIVEVLQIAVGDEVKVNEIVCKLEHERQLHAYLVAKLRAENDGPIDVAEGEVEEKSAALEDVRRRFRRKQATDTQVSQAEGQQRSSIGRLKQARMARELAQLELAMAEKALERRYIRSRIAGTVVAIVRGRDEKAAEGDIVVTVADAAQVTTQIPVTQESAAGLSTSSTFPVRLAGTNVVRMARVTSIVPMPHATKGEQMVQVVFDNADPISVLKERAFEVLLPAQIKTAPIAKEQPKPKPPATSKG